MSSNPPSLPSEASSIGMVRQSSSSSGGLSNPHSMNYNNDSFHESTPLPPPQQCQQEEGHHQSWDNYGSSSLSSKQKGGGNSTASHEHAMSGVASSSSHMACLYTKHKTQKRKVWNDGRLVLRGCRACIHDANPPAGSTDVTLDETELTMAQIHAIRKLEMTNMETEKFLVTVEGPWVAVKNKVNTLPSSLGKRAVSSGMQKLLKSKFRKPGTGYVPPHPMEKKRRIIGQPMGKGGMKMRRAPLQPGELEKRYYGDGAHAGMAGTSMVNNMGGAGHALPEGGRGGIHEEFIDGRSSAQHRSGYNDLNAQPSRHLLPPKPPAGKEYPPSHQQHNFNENDIMYGPPPHHSRDESHEAHNGRTNTPSLRNIEGRKGEDCRSDPTNRVCQKQGGQQQSNHAKFSKNEFDPSGFYGEEEDDDDDGSSDDTEEEEGAGAYANQRKAHQGASNNLDTMGRSVCFRQNQEYSNEMSVERKNMHRSDVDNNMNSHVHFAQDPLGPTNNNKGGNYINNQSEPRQPVINEKVGGRKESTSYGLSKDALLQLFGACPSSPEVKQQKEGTNDDLSSKNEGGGRQKSESNNSRDVSPNGNMIKQHETSSDNSNKETTSVGKQIEVSKTVESNNPFLAQLMRADAEVDRRIEKEDDKYGSSDEEDEYNMWNDHGIDKDGHEAGDEFALDEDNYNIEGLTEISNNSQNQISDQNQDKISGPSRQQGFVDMGGTCKVDRFCSRDGESDVIYKLPKATQAEQKADSKSGFALPPQSESSSDESDSSEDDDS
mmetsp:Transcript_2018/g.2876  ORF Transcript_2018/g.2876 Transcript_2018/m.2876 type:complete len:773 (+) Transcript_2018:155-2473(+)